MSSGSKDQKGYVNPFQLPLDAWPPSIADDELALFLAMDKWTVAEAIALAFGVSPKSTSSAAWRSDYAFGAQALQWIDLLGRAGIVRDGFVQPAEFMEWLRALPLPDKPPQWQVLDDSLRSRRDLREPNPRANDQQNRNLKRALMAIIFARYGGARSWNQALTGAANDIERVVHPDAGGTVGYKALENWVKEALGALEEDVRVKVNPKRRGDWKFPEKPWELPDPGQDDQ